jgi:hypothetical protein
MVGDHGCVPPRTIRFRQSTPYSRLAVAGLACEPIICRRWSEA